MMKKVWSRLILMIVLVTVGFGFDFSPQTVLIEKDNLQFHEDFKLADLSKKDKNDLYRELDSVTQLHDSMPKATSYSQIEPFHQYKDLEELLKNSQSKPIVIYFGYDTCPYCRAFVPKVNQLAKENDVTIHYYNTDEHFNDPDFNAIVEPFKIETVPHAFLIEDEKIIEVINEKSEMKEMEDFFNKASSDND